MSEAGTKSTMPRAFLFCTIYVPRNEKPQAISRINSWIKFYQGKKDLLGFRNIFLIDDGSAIEDIKDIAPGVNIIEPEAGLPEVLPEGISIFHFQKRLGRGKNCVFPGWWRSFTFSSKIAKKYNFDKLILCEPDAYIIRDRLFSYIKSVAKGWVSLWCPKHKFPESAIQVICKDSINKLEEMHEKGEALWNLDVIAERFLPFTKVEKRFIGDRYGEFLEKYPYDADYICQAWLNNSVMGRGSFPAIKITLSRKWKRIKTNFKKLTGRKQ